MIKLTLTGRPITKKNSQIPIKTKSGKFFIIQSKQYRAYEKDCLLQIKEQFPWQITTALHPGLPITGKLHLEVLYYMPDRRLPDLLNLLAATSDIIEKAGVIENDRDIVSFDYSRIMEADKENPRAEVFIEEMMEVEC